MFKAIYHTGYKGYNKARYRIEDSDFIEDDVSCDIDSIPFDNKIGAVITCYSLRHLNVPLNVALCHIYLSRTNFIFEYVIENEINYCMNSIPEYNKYVNDIKKYLDRFNKIKAFW